VETGRPFKEQARIPAGLIFQDAAGRSLHLLEALAGRPALILPVVFTCRTLCGPALTIASAALAETGLEPGQDFQFGVLGFDPDVARQFLKMCETLHNPKRPI
jgi:protein SCO1